MTTARARVMMFLPFLGRGYPAPRVAISHLDCLAFVSGSHFTHPCARHLGIDAGEVGRRAPRKPTFAAVLYRLDRARDLDELCAASGSARGRSSMNFIRSARPRCAARRRQDLALGDQQQARGSIFPGNARGIANNPHRDSRPAGLFAPGVCALINHTAGRSRGVVGGGPT